MIESLRQDCNRHGRGRKRWWANRLAVPPLTISHWLHGRQKPNGRHAVILKETLDSLGHQEQKSVWKDAVWECYYSGQDIPSQILSLFIPEILALPLLDSRTLALLSHLVEKSCLSFRIPAPGFVKNRLGWLLEVSGQKSAFSPSPLPKTQHLLELSERINPHQRYFRSLQTRQGRKWRLYDCPLDSLKKAFL